jgi:hypothetical protein
MASTINAITSGGGGIAVGGDTSGVIGLQSNGTTFATGNQYGIGLGTAVPSSGIGIAFPATQSASSDANTLDDYEEGTWTITATPATSGTLTASANKTGAYTKVGRTVAVTGFFGITSTSSPVGSSVNLSLPFAIATLTESAARFGTVVNSYNGVTQTSLPCIGVQGDAYIRITVTASSLSAGQDFGFTFSYITTA